MLQRMQCIWILKNDRKVFFYEFLVGGSAMLTATILYGFLHLL